MYRFDLEETFGDDYLYFYSSVLTDQRSDAETEEVVELLGLPPAHGPGCWMPRAATAGSPTVWPPGASR